MYQKGWRRVEKAAPNESLCWLQAEMLKSSMHAHSGWRGWDGKPRAWVPGSSQS